PDGGRSRGATRWRRDRSWRRGGSGQWSVDSVVAGSEWREGGRSWRIRANCLSSLSTDHCPLPTFVHTCTPGRLRRRLSEDFGMRLRLRSHRLSRGNTFGSTSFDTPLPALLSDMSSTVRLTSVADSTIARDPFSRS